MQQKIQREAPYALRSATTVRGGVKWEEIETGKLASLTIWVFDRRHEFL